jgi:hypothetical protein
MDAYTVLAADDSMTKISVQTDEMYQNDDVSRNRDEVRRTIRNAITIAEDRISQSSHSCGDASNRS